MTLLSALRIERRNFLRYFPGEDLCGEQLARCLSQNHPPHRVPLPRKFCPRPDGQRWGARRV